MNISRQLWWIFLISTLFFISCEKQNTPSDTDKVQPDSVSLSVTSLDIEPKGATNLIFKFSPWKSTWTVDNVKLNYSGASSAHCNLKSYVDCGNGAFEVCIVDNGVGKCYSDDFIISAEVNGTKYSTKSFTISSSNIHTSNLPVVRITTTSAVADEVTWVQGSMTIEGQNDYPDLTVDTIQIRGRGNASWFYQKKPYAIKLNSKLSVLGMARQKHWCLIANYCDKTLLRNAVAYYIGQHTNLAWTPHYRFVDLYLNGKYEGNYQLIEQIRVDKNRVNIHEMKNTNNDGDKLTGGYLLEMDTNYDEEKKFKSSYSQMPVNVKYPDSDDITDTQFNYIQTYVNESDNILFNSWFANAQKGWSTKFDMASFADYWLVNELMNNLELKFPKSFFMYKPRNGKLTAGPIWDFDCGTLIKSDENSWSVARRCLWIGRMLNDPEFNKLAVTRWKAMYPFLTTVPDYIKAQAEYIKSSAANNFVRWPKISADFANGDESLSWDDAVNLLIEVYKARLEWLNAQITSGKIPTF